MADVKKIGLLDLAIILLERKRLLVISMLVFSAAGITTSLLMHKEYIAKATIMKPAQKMTSGLGSILGKDLPISGLLKSMDLLGSGSSDAFLSILESRRLAEKVIDRFNLIHRYKFDKKKKYYYEDVLKRLSRNVGIAENNYGNIEVFVADTSPAMAADMVNFIVNELDTINFLLAKESAHNSRLFFEDRLGVIKNDLDSASKSFSTFQIQNNYIELDQQVKSSIEAVAQFEAQKMAMDLEIAQLKNQFGTNNQRVAELQKSKRVIETKIDGYMNEGGGSLIIALRKAPQKAVEYGYLLRNVKIQETLYEFVIQLFEQAKFTEANDVPSVQVLEYAKPPQKKSRPKRSIICLLFFFSGFAATSLYILLDKWYRVQQQHQTALYDKTQKIKSLLSIQK
jgi:tyrosine-protein kinase Etk/Wzc